MGTRLRFLQAKSKRDLIVMIESLPFKIEIKGMPFKEGKEWTIWFTVDEKNTMTKLLDKD